MSANDQIVFRRRNVGFMFQLCNLLPALTAAENAAVPLFVAGDPRREGVGWLAALRTFLGPSGGGWRWLACSSITRAWRYATSRPRRWTRRAATPSWNCSRE